MQCPKEITLLAVLCGFIFWNSDKNFGKRIGWVYLGKVIKPRMRDVEYGYTESVYLTIEEALENADSFAFSINPTSH